MRTRLAAAATTAAAVLALAACSSNSGDNTAGSTSSASAATPSTSVSSLPPKPQGPALAAYLAALKVVDPDLVTDQDGAVEDGRTQCAVLSTDPDTADHLAAQRFSTPGKQLSDAQGKLIDTALRATLCPSV